MTWMIRADGKIFSGIYGPENFQFAHGHTRFVAINCTCATNGPREEDLAFLEKALKEDNHKVKIVLMHMPPNLGDHYAPRAQWGFKDNEAAFLAIVKKHGVKLVCCAHVIAYDNYVHDDICYVVSGGLGWELATTTVIFWEIRRSEGRFIILWKSRWQRMGR